MISIPFHGLQNKICRSLCEFVSFESHIPASKEYIIDVYL